MNPIAPFSQPEPESSPSSKPDKGIFKYNNGLEDVYGDPFEIDWRLQDATKLIPDINVIQSRLWIMYDEKGQRKESSDSDLALCMDAWHTFAPIIAKGFEVKPFDKKTGEGMTVSSLIDLYTDYLAWQYGVKKNSD